MKIWAFGVSPRGLALSPEQLWALTPWQHRELREVWDLDHKFSSAMYYQLRADIHNSSENLNRQDKRRWSAQDFGADAPAQSDPRRTFTPQEADRMIRGTFGGRLNDTEGKPVSALKGLKGQKLPSALQAKIKVVEVKVPEKKTRNLRVARGPSK